MVSWQMLVAVAVIVWLVVAVVFGLLAAVLFIAGYLFGWLTAS